MGTDVSEVGVAVDFRLVAQRGRTKLPRERRYPILMADHYESSFRNVSTGVSREVRPHFHQISGFLGLISSCCYHYGRDIYFHLFGDFTSGPQPASFTPRLFSQVLPLMRRCSGACRQSSG